MRLKRPGSSRYVELKAGEKIPVGTSVDTRDGRVTITAAAGRGKTVTADFFDGLFKLSQSKASVPVTTLTLTEALNCPRGKKASAAAKPKTRKLWGDGKGKFRTKGSYSAATVRGTRWLTQDRCDSTLTRVRKGVVSVRDEVKKKTVLVRAGRSYTARQKSARRATPPAGPAATSEIARRPRATRSSRSPRRRRGAARRHSGRRRRCPDSPGRRP